MKKHNQFEYERMIVAYHGCDLMVRDKVISGKEPLYKSEKAYDWLGHGIYFWEHGKDRALQWAQERKGEAVKTPSVVGALIHLGSCFDLLDTKYTRLLTLAWPQYIQDLKEQGKPLPENKPANKSDIDQVIRILDCSMINWTIQQLEKSTGVQIDSVRGVFPEDEPVFPGSSILKKSHIQISVRNPDCILGYFLPS